MEKWNGFRGKAKRLDDLDLPRIGAMIDVGEDEVHAVLEVESAGSGFDAEGRPRLLFEPHVFFRNLSGEKRDRAVKAGLAYPNWKPGSYPKDSYPRLEAAISIDETEALKSGSFGLGQILGENHKDAGYATVQDMVRDCIDDEERHLLMMIAFIKTKKLDDELRRHDWASFARGYNGAQYAKHNYHGRLAAAFARWQKIKDTPWREAAAAEDVAADQASPILRVGSEGMDVVRLQQLLIAKGAALYVDGDFGPKTEDALRAFQRARGLDADGIAGADTWAALA